MLIDSIPERLVQLRVKKNVSAREMSLAIGQNENYINRIENRKMLPSMQALFYICEYLNITPAEFFDEGNANPERLSELIEDLRKLDEKALASVASIVKELIGK